MDEHFDAIEDISVWIVRIKGLVTRHLLIGVVVLHHVIVNDDAQRAAYDLVVGDTHHLTFGKDIDKFLNLLVCPENIVVGIDTMERAGKLVVVRHLQRAEALSC